MRTISTLYGSHHCYGFDKKSKCYKVLVMESKQKYSFFGKYMGRINFECILSNIHLSDNTLVSTDPLVKLKPFIDMCDRNFLHVYKSNKNISVDEASCKWKGRFSHTKCTIPESHQNFT